MGGGDQSIHKARAGAIDIEGRGDTTKATLEHAGGGGRDEIGGHGGHDDQINILMGDAGSRQAIFDGVPSEITGTYSGFGLVAFADPGSLDDPLAIATKGGEVIVGDDFGRQVGSGGRDAKAGKFSEPASP